MTIKQYAGIVCNEKFLEIDTGSYSGWVTDDPMGEDIYLKPLADFKTVGESLLKAFAKSRDVSISKEDRQALIDGKVTRQWINEKYPGREWTTPVACAARYQDWLQRMIKEYEYKTKTALLKNMQHVSVENDGELITFSSLWHLTTDSWGNPDGKTPSVEMKIASTSSLEVIGAAVRYAIGNCQGKGADFIRELLFPDGQPETFEQYLESLGFSMKG